MSRHAQPVSGVVVREFKLGAEGSATPPLAADEIHLWRQNLARGTLEIEAFRRLLSPDELERAGRFRFDADCDDFIVSRGTLRTLLGAYLDLPPQELRFTYSQYGRPILMVGSAANGLDFNVSHSGGMMLLAFARGRRIGIDVERVRRDFATTEIAERFFSLAERAALRQLSQEQRHEAFFLCWTRKEAFIKALGEGLSHPLDQFDVSLAPGQPAVLLATRPDAREASRWLFWNVQVPGDYAATLAAESRSMPA
jgi:4'-phosphopantetheinyl transferase